MGGDEGAGGACGCVQCVSCVCEGACGVYGVCAERHRLGRALYRQRREGARARCYPPLAAGAGAVSCAASVSTCLGVPGRVTR
jgi:hypothetical protein